jgi:tRNA N6-adenosine threonylcarbamoyltransferase
MSSGAVDASTCILGIETSCDETAAAVVMGGTSVLSSVVSSQVDLHARFGGVVPEIAARAHLTNLPPLLDRTLAEGGATLRDVTLVAATAGPGLVGALLVGLSEAKGIAFGLGVPFVPVHHIEAHALSPFLGADGEPARPVPDAFSALVVSGGHTHLYRFRGRHVALLARTRDDAAGEAYDKVAKMAGLGYPGGPVVDRLARSGRPAQPFAVPRFSDGSIDFSFSGLKTAVRDRLAALGLRPQTGIPDAIRTVEEDEAPPPLRDLLAEFQEAVVAQLEDRLSRVLGEEPFVTLTVSGGVAANSLLRERLPAWGRKRAVEVLLPDRAFTGDNAVMVAFAGLRRHLAGRGGEGLAAVARSRWPLESQTDF